MDHKLVGCLLIVFQIFNTHSLAFEHSQTINLVGFVRHRPFKFEDLKQGHELFEGNGKEDQVQQYSNEKSYFVDSQIKWNLNSTLEFFERDLIGQVFGTLPAKTKSLLHNLLYLLCQLFPIKVIYQYLGYDQGSFFYIESIRKLISAFTELVPFKILIEFLRQYRSDPYEVPQYLLPDYNFPTNQELAELPQKYNTLFLILIDFVKCLIPVISFNDMLILIQNNFNFNFNERLDNKVRSLLHICQILALMFKNCFKNPKPFDWPPTKSHIEWQPPITYSTAPDTSSWDDWNPKSTPKHVWPAWNKTKKPTSTTPLPPKVTYPEIVWPRWPSTSGTTKATIPPFPTNRPAWTTSRPKPTWPTLPPFIQTSPEPPPPSNPAWFPSQVEFNMNVFIYYLYFQVECGSHPDKFLPANKKCEEYYNQIRDLHVGCEFATKWEINCYQCECTLLGPFCTKVEHCLPQLPEKQMTCKPYTTWILDECNTCECNGDGQPVCTLNECPKWWAIPEHCVNCLDNLPKCAPASTWVSKCHKCKCDDFGSYSCYRESDCVVPLQDARPCRPSSSFNGCHCNDEGISVCPGYNPFVNVKPLLAL